MATNYKPTTIFPTSHTVNIAGPGSTYSIGTATSGIYTSPLYNGSTWSTSAVNIDNSSMSGQISLQGDNADVNINGKSLKKFIEDVEQRLNILSINKDLEKEWAELKEIGDRYRELEKEIQEKMKTWDILKKE